MHILNETIYGMCEFVKMQAYIKQLDGVMKKTGGREKDETEVQD